MTDSEGNSEVTDGGGAGGGVTEASPLNDLQVQLVVLEQKVACNQGRVKIRGRINNFC